MTIPNTNTPYALWLRNNIRVAIKQAKEQKRTGMTYEQLHNATKRPESLDGVPDTMADFNLLFSVICDLDPEIKTFIND
jgi:hypothetical protein